MISITPVQNIPEKKYVGRISKYQSLIDETISVLHNHGDVVRWEDPSWTKVEAQKARASALRILLKKNNDVRSYRISSRGKYVFVQLLSNTKNRSTSTFHRLNNDEVSA